MNEAPDRRVRVTFLIGSLDIGGAEQQLVRLVNELDRERFQPSVLCLWRGGPLETKLRSDVQVDGIRLDRVEHRGVRSKALLAARIFWTIGRGLRGQRPDILHAYLPAAYVLGAVAAWFLRVPVVIAARRGLDSYHVYPYLRWRLLARFANRVIALHLCNSEAVRHYAIEKEHLRSSQTAVVHNGLDLLSIGGAPPLPEGWRTSRTKFLAISVANLIHYKNHPMLLRAVRRVLAEEPDFRLVLAGEGPERGALEALAAELGIAPHVVFAGSVESAASYLSAFDLSLLTSRHEGLPNAVMESLAAGVPVVATAVGGTVELVDDGVEGLLVPSDDDASLAAAILRLVHDPKLRQRMGEAGRQRIASQFAVSRMVSQTEEIYLRLLGARRPARVAA